MFEFYIYNGVTDVFYDIPFNSHLDCWANVVQAYFGGSIYDLTEKEYWWFANECEIKSRVASDRLVKELVWSLIQEGHKFLYYDFEEKIFLGYDKFLR